MGNQVSDNGPRSIVPSASDDLKTVACCNALLNKIGEDYENIGQLLKHNSVGTLLLLKGSGALVAEELSNWMKELDNTGYEHSNNISSWKNYKQAIEEYLIKTAKKAFANKPDCLQLIDALKPAIASLAELIWIKHYNAYPKWPEVYCENPWQTVYLSESGSLLPSHGGQYYFAWMVDGYVDVKDTRPARQKFIAHLRGDPSIKMLKCEKRKLLEVESKIESVGLSKMKSAVNQLQQNNSEESLNWDFMKKLTL